MSQNDALTLLALTLGAFTMPILAERIDWFNAPCEMLYGIIVANLIPGMRFDGAFISALSEFGFLLLLFLVGLEIDFEALRKQGPTSLLTASLAAIGIQAGAFVLALFLHLPIIYALIMGALSVTLIIAILHESDLVRETFGQRLLIVGALGEFIAILALTSYDLFSRYGFNWELGVAAGKLIALLILGYISLRGLLALVNTQSGVVRRLLALRDTSELGVRAALALMLVFVAAALLLRVEAILATFIAGAISSFAFRGRNYVTEKLTTMGQGFFLPIFFITVGAQVRFVDLMTPAALTTLIALTVGVFAVRLAAIPLLRIAGIKWRMALPAALMLSAPLSIMVAMARVGANLGVLSSSMVAAILGASIVTATLYPLLARPFLLRHSRHTSAKTAPLPQRPNSTPPREPELDEAPA